MIRAASILLTLLFLLAGMFTVGAKASTASGFTFESLGRDAHGRHTGTTVTKGASSLYASTIFYESGSGPATELTLGYDRADQLTSATLALAAPPQTVSKKYSYQYDYAGNRTSRQSDNLVDTSAVNSANRITGTSGGGRLLVSGSTNEPAKIKVNGQPATTTPPPGNVFQAWITVAPGPNTIAIEATDYANPPNTTAPVPSWNVNVTGSPERSFTYDLNGNTLGDGLRTYQWDAENRLVKITQGSNVHEFIYDGAYRRVAEKLNGTIIKRWIWDGTAIAEERTADGTTITRRYYSEGEQRIGGTNAGSYYYTRDHLGSIREMTDSAAVVRARYDYDPYGTRTKIAGDLDCDFGFTGHHLHAPTGLHLTLFRAYDLELGRWLSVDPIGEAGGLNLYGYVSGNPVNGVDPLGLVCYGLPNEYAASSEYRKAFHQGMGQGFLPGAALTAAYFAPGAVRAVAARYPRLFIGGVAALDETGVLAAGGGAYLARNWHRGTFPEIMQSVNYHVGKHGKGRCASDYTKAALDFFNKNKHLASKITLKDGTPGLRIKVKGEGGGYWTEGGKIVTFWD